MDAYEELLESAYNEGLIVKEMPLQSSDGRIYGNRIAIRQDITTSIQKAGALAEELGHYYTTVGNIHNQSIIENRKQERQARLHGYNRLIGLMGIIHAFNTGCQNKYEIADFLDVTEEYLEECISCYRDKYGVYTTVDNYIIYFIPNLVVVEMM